MHTVFKEVFQILLAVLLDLVVGLVRSDQRQDIVC